MIAYCDIGIEDLTLVQLPISPKAHFSNRHLCISYPFLSCLAIALVLKSFLITHYEVDDFFFLSEPPDSQELLTVFVYCLGSHDAHVSFTIMLTQAVVEGDLNVFPFHRCRCLYIPCLDFVRHSSVFTFLSFWNLRPLFIFLL